MKQTGKRERRNRTTSSWYSQNSCHMYEEQCLLPFQELLKTGFYELCWGTKQLHWKGKQLLRLSAEKKQKSLKEVVWEQWLLSEHKACFPTWRHGCQRHLLICLSSSSPAHLCLLLEDKCCLCGWLIQFSKVNKKQFWEPTLSDQA